MKLTQFESAISEIVVSPSGDFQHPFLTKIKFVFADNKGNANNQGIEAEDFSAVAIASINMPIKIRYGHSGAGGHDFAVPIGHITGMDMVTDADDADNVKLVGEAVLYAEEYPDEVEYLKESFEHGHAPGISWEMSYRDSVKKNGVDWLKGAVTRAATFVKFPAYGQRTALLAIASQQDNNEFMQELQSLLDKWTQAGVPNTDKGGQNVDEKELQEQIEKLEKAAAELEDRIKALETELETTKAENVTLAEENNGFKRSAIIADRTAKVVEAGYKVADDQLEAKQALWVSFSEEQFAAYVADLAAISKPTTPIKDASASAKKDDLPKFIAVAGTETSLDDLKAVGRRASRGQLAEL